MKKILLLFAIFIVSGIMVHAQDDDKKFDVKFEKEIWVGGIDRHAWIYHKQLPGTGIIRIWKDLF